MCSRNAIAAILIALSAFYFKTVGTQPVLSEKLVCAADKVHVRKWPDQTSDKLGELFDGDEVTVLDRTKTKSKITIHGIAYDREWVMIKTPAGLIGWVFGAFLYRHHFHQPVPDKYLVKEFAAMFHFCPMGWSEDGKFAYMNETMYVYAVMRNRPEYYIIDTATNKVLFEVKGENDMKDVWTPYRLLLHKKLDHYRILPTPGRSTQLNISDHGEIYPFLKVHTALQLNKGMVKVKYYDLYISFYKKQTKVFSKTLLYEIQPDPIVRCMLTSPLSAHCVVIVDYLAEVDPPYEVIGIKLPEKKVIE